MLTPGPALALVTLVSALIDTATVAAPGAGLQTLVQALNTTERTWIYARTYVGQSDLYCSYYDKDLLMATADYYVYFFFYGNRWCKILEYAELYGGCTEGLACMDIRENVGDTAVRKYLMYWNSTENCGIYTLYLENRRECELHIRDGALPQAHSQKASAVPCATRFFQYCPTGNYTEIVYYLSTCKATIGEWPQQCTS
ncbi:uncharacterized protein LOC142563988 [Dermacentor variabilis]|uniref:uncharacterized protein LOC142563988 n=1 Tax=Dermacentor variabilis TaxID=34621 RepID=UPI003F5C75C7